MRGAESLGVGADEGVAVAVDGGDGETVEPVGAGLALACGEQAVLRRTAATSADRTAFTADITTAERICYLMTSDDMAQLVPLLGDSGLEVEVLREMSFYAARWRPGHENDLRAPVLSDDHVARYLEGWGRPGDMGFLAEEDGKPVGAAWLRLFTRERPGYGFVDTTIPELSIAVVPARRGSGIGLALLTATLAGAKQAGHSAVSLSVEVDNPAQRLYERVGFKKVERVGGSWTMRLDLGRAQRGPDSVLTR